MKIEDRISLKEDGDLIYFRWSDVESVCFMSSDAPMCQVRMRTGCVWTFTSRKCISRLWARLNPSDPLPKEYTPAWTSLDDHPKLPFPDVQDDRAAAIG